MIFGFRFSPSLFPSSPSSLRNRGDHMGSGAFLASSGLRWNLRCACRSRILPAIRWQTFQSLSSHHASFISAIGIVRYPQRLSRVGVLVQWMQIAASLGNSSVPSGGQMAIFTSSLAVSTRGIIVRSPIFHRPSLSFPMHTRERCSRVRRLAHRRRHHLHHWRACPF